VRQGEATALAAEQMYVLPTLLYVIFNYFSFSMGRVITTAESPNAYSLLGTLRMVQIQKYTKFLILILFFRRMQMHKYGK
jgi:hypothetical protein